jgi:flagellar hook protein FlgE
MPSSLISGLSGLRAHRQYLEVIGNNLANVNTDGFKGSRVTFADLYGETIDPGSSSSEATGGTDPSQVGAGSTVASVDQNMAQGTFRTTGRELDLAIEGNGFFAVEAPDRTLYSRVGTFTVNGDGDLVDQRTGYRVLDVSSEAISLPLESVQAGQTTGSVTLRGNLPGEVTGPFAESLASSLSWAEGTHAQIAGANSGPFALADGQTLSIRVDGGTAQTVTFRTADFASIGAATAAEVVAAINAQTTGLTASVSGSVIDLASDRTGSESSLDVDDGTGSPAITLGLSTTLTSGTTSAATTATTLNDLADNVVDYVDGDRIHVSGTEADGSAISATFVYGAAGNGTTLDDLLTFISAQYESATASLDSSGRIVIAADEAGEASLSMSLADDTVNTGSTRFEDHFLEVTQRGADPDRVRTAIEIFDAQGRPHTLDIVLERSTSNEWDLVASLSGTGSTFIDGEVRGIRFTPSGAFEAVTGPGNGDANLTIQWDDLGGATQTITLDLGSGGQFDGLTQFGGSTTAQAVQQDGFGAGSLESISVSHDGSIQGFYNNGRTVDLDQIGLAHFGNVAGLERVGQTLFAASAASGTPQLGTAGTGGRGAVRAGVLEQSNVDMAEEFVRLIEAQRGFQANARLISTTDEVLAELVQIV